MAQILYSKILEFRWAFTGDYLSLNLNISIGVNVRAFTWDYLSLNLVICIGGDVWWSFSDPSSWIMFFVLYDVRCFSVFPPFSGLPGLMPLEHRWPMFLLCPCFDLYYVRLHLLFATITCPYRDLFKRRGHVCWFLFSKVFCLVFTLSSAYFPFMFLLGCPFPILPIQLQWTIGSRISKREFIFYLFSPWGSRFVLECCTLKCSCGLMKVWLITQ